MGQPRGLERFADISCQGLDEMPFHRLALEKKFSIPDHYNVHIPAPVIYNMIRQDSKTITLIPRTQ